MAKQRTPEISGVLIYEALRAVEVQHPFVCHSRLVHELLELLRQRACRMLQGDCLSEQRAWEECWGEFVGRDSVTHHAAPLLLSPTLALSIVTMSQKLFHACSISRRIKNNVISGGLGRKALKQLRATNPPRSRTQVRVQEAKAHGNAAFVEAPSIIDWSGATSTLRALRRRNKAAKRWAKLLAKMVHVDANVVYPKP